MIGLLALLAACGGASDTVESKVTNARDIEVVAPLGDALHDVRQRRYGDVGRELSRINLQSGSTPYGDRVRQAETRREMDTVYEGIKASWDYWTD